MICCSILYTKVSYIINISKIFNTVFTVSEIILPTPFICFLCTQDQCVCVHVRCKFRVGLGDRKYSLHGRKPIAPMEYLHTHKKKERMETSLSLSNVLFRQILFALTSSSWRAVFPLVTTMTTQRCTVPPYWQQTVPQLDKSVYLYGPTTPYPSFCGPPKYN